MTIIFLDCHVRLGPSNLNFDITPAVYNIHLHSSDIACNSEINQLVSITNGDEINRFKMSVYIYPSNMSV